MAGITGASGYPDFIGRMGPGNPLNQGSVNPLSFLNMYRENVQPGGFNITQSGGSVLDDLGKVTTSGGRGGRGVVNTATAASTAFPGIGTIQEQLTNLKQQPFVQATKQAAKETLGSVPQGARGAFAGAQGFGKGIMKSIAPKAYQEAVTRGAQAQALARAAGASRPAIKAAGMVPGVKVAGRWAGRRVPFLGAALDLAAGDPLAATGTLAGGAIGGALTLGSPVGIAVGSMLGAPILKGGRQLLSPIFGDPSDPLSGRDWSIGGMPITPYAKTKRSMEKQAKLYTDIQLPLMEQINNAQFEREMRMARLGMAQNLMSSTNQLMAQAYGTSSY